MQMADACEVFPMLDGKKIRAAVEKHKPDVIIPEIEAIDTSALAELEKQGWRVVATGGTDGEPRAVDEIADEVWRAVEPLLR